MGKFEIKNQNLTTQFEYENENVTVTGSYSSDKGETAVQGINGQIHRLPDGEGGGEYVGNFSGTLVDGEMEYTLSRMTRRNTTLAWAAIDDIEQNINRQNGGGEA